jgi:hypothetical protein
MPYPENALLRRRSQIFTEADKTELDPVDLDDGWFPAFLERAARIIRKIGGKK